MGGGASSALIPTVAQAGDCAWPGVGSPDQAHVPRSKANDTGFNVRIKKILPDESLSRRS
jgi:hypothetical protein